MIKRFVFLPAAALCVAVSTLSALAAVPAHAVTGYAALERTFPSGAHRDATFSNPIVPDPPLVRPTTQSCVVTLLTAYPFQNFTPATGSYAPPAGCPGPWSAVILDVTTSVMGVQFDRLGALWLGNTEIYRFTTSEPPGPQIQWHVEKDVTEYANTLQTANNYTYSLGNVVNGTYTGIYYVTATLTFYEPGSGFPAATTPDSVIPIANAAASPPWYTLNTPTDQASSSVTVPANSQGAVLEVYATGHSCEEFWYANESTAFESQLGSTCGGTAFREIDVSIDGKPAGVVFPYPYLYTGAIDPIAWLPLTGYDTLDIPPYQVDLTPFVGYLNDKKPHTIAAQVFNDTGGFWLADADLLITEDHGSTRTHGKLLSLQAGPSNPETYNESNLNIQTGGTAWYSGVHNVQATGYVDTSQGRVTSTASTSLHFINQQALTNPQSQNGTEVVTMLQRGTTTVSHVSSSGSTSTTTQTQWPFYLGLKTQLNIDQEYLSQTSTLTNGVASSASKNVRITVATSGGESTKEHFQLYNSAGYCYNRSLSAASGKLLSDTQACNGKK
jgi:Peptide N-acetyl-beta-D-glucosaminyl asparaginase amidase A